MGFGVGTVPRIEGKVRANATLGRCESVLFLGLCNSQYWLA